MVGSLYLSSPAFAGASLSVSNEVSGNNATARTKANALDDAWGASFATGAYRPNLFSSGSGYAGSKTFTDPTGASYKVDWSVGYINQFGPGLPTSTTFIQATSGSIYYSSSTKIQATAPNPYTSDNRLSTSVTGSGLRALKLDFTDSTTDIYDFGIYIGDLESRANNGTLGRVIVFNQAGAVIGDDPIIYTGTVQTSGADITYPVVEPAGSPSGPNNNPSGLWGNNTTAFLSVSSDEAIGSVIIHVGDDDHTTNNTGSNEQLGVTGFQIPAAPTSVNNAQLVAEKTVDMFSPSSYALPGEDVIYSIYVANEGSGAVDADTIFIVDSLPDNMTFYNGDIDGSGPETAAVSFSQNTSSLAFHPANDVGYSDSSIKPTNYQACNYSPTAGYDLAVKYICFNPKGALASGTPYPDFTVKFRAKIK